VQDYSTTPLSIKLGIKEDSTLAFLYAPKSFSLEMAVSGSQRNGPVNQQR
jgi:hypothetical protein